MKLYMIECTDGDGSDLSLFVETDQGPDDALKLWREWDFVAEYPEESLAPKVFEIAPQGIRGIVTWHVHARLVLGAAS